MTKCWLIEVLQILLAHTIPHFRNNWREFHLFRTLSSIFVHFSCHQPPKFSTIFKSGLFAGQAETSISRFCNHLIVHADLCTDAPSCSLVQRSILLPKLQLQTKADCSPKVHVMFCNSYYRTQKLFPMYRNIELLSSSSKSYQFADTSRKSCHFFWNRASGQLVFLVRPDRTSPRQKILLASKN